MAETKRWGGRSAQWTGRRQHGGWGGGCMTDGGQPAWGMGRELHA